jgi:hypothetical protein
LQASQQQVPEQNMQQHKAQKIISHWQTMIMSTRQDIAAAAGKSEMQVTRN